MDAFFGAMALVVPIVLFAAMLAFTVERVVEKFVKPPLARAGLDRYADYAALLLGVLVVVGLNVDFFLPIALHLGLNPLLPQVGLGLSAIVVGGGSNLIHDIWPGVSDALRDYLKKAPNASRHLP